ncbi:MAG: tRNA 4-thiouridine(8) synthase ThiI, partial [Clostridia bacterium]|nr:tRNA 4-thiouridine(8) synthase ThiI [Clostridia bacterium]
MKEIILIKDGELALKGLNRRNFEDKLTKNIKSALKSLGSVEVVRSQSVAQITPLEDMDLNLAEQKLKKVFGIATLVRSCIVEKDMDVILDTVCDYLREKLEDASTFKVNAKRSDKKFPLKSPEICEIVGERVLDTFPHIKVDVHNPDVTITVEIRDFGAYIHADAVPGAGGLPVGTGGRAAILVSGGIDSPVAAWMMAKRGLGLLAVHFASPPYT